MSLDQLYGRTALVTGGAGGIGQGVAKALLEKGARVVLGDLEEDALDGALRNLQAWAGEDGRVLARKLDVTREESVRAAFEWAEAQFGYADILVNNAGVCIAHPFLEGTEDEYRTTVDVNLHGVLRVSRIFAKRLVGMGRPGNIVNVASNAAKRPYARYVEYSATKAAVVNLTHTLSQELSPYEINVNAVCPGAVDTRMLEYCMREAITTSNRAFNMETCRATWGPAQLGRLVRSEEVGRVVAFLSSPSANIIRGQSILVDAGDTSY